MISSIKIIFPFFSLVFGKSPQANVSVEKKEEYEFFIKRMLLLI